MPYGDADNQENEEGVPSIEPSQPSPRVVEESSIPDSIYRTFGDTWKCRNCDVKGDKWFMIKHPQHCRSPKK